MCPRVVLRGVPALVLTLALLSTASCGSGKIKLYPVRGKVLCDGKPTDGALITLRALDASQPIKELPTARVKADGTFSIGTYTAEDGAPPGEYKVSIFWMPPDFEAQAIRTGKYPNRLPDVYGDAKASPLKIQVQEAPNDLPPYELSSAKPTRR